MVYRSQSEPSTGGSLYRVAQRGERRGNSGKGGSGLDPDEILKDGGRGKGGTHPGGGHPLRKTKRGRVHAYGWKKFKDSGGEEKNLPVLRGKKKRGPCPTSLVSGSVERDKTKARGGKENPRRNHEKRTEKQNASRPSLLSLRAIRKRGTGG